MNYFFFTDTATTEIYTLSLHDALPIFLVHVDADLPEPRNDLVRREGRNLPRCDDLPGAGLEPLLRVLNQDRKSTRLNSSHANISYAVFCLKKKKIIISFILLTSSPQYI